MRAYQRIYAIRSPAFSLLMLIFSGKKIVYLLINVLHYHYVIEDVIIIKYCFSVIFQNKLYLHIKNIHCYQLLIDIKKIILQYF